MKKLLLLCIMGFGIGAIAQTKYTPEYLRDDDKAFKAIAKRMTPTGWIEFDESAKIARDSFFDKYGKSLGLQKDYTLKKVSDVLDHLGNRHELYQLYYQDLKVEGVQYSLHSKKGMITLAHGRIVDFLKADISKALKEDKLWQEMAKTVKFKAEKYEKEKPQSELVIAMKDESDYNSTPSVRSL